MSQIALGGFRNGQVGVRINPRVYENCGRSSLLQIIAQILQVPDTIDVISLLQFSQIVDRPEVLRLFWHKEQTLTAGIVDDTKTAGLLHSEQIPECAFLLDNMTTVLVVVGDSLDASE